MSIKETLRHAEVFTCRTELEPYVSIETLKKVNESKLLEYLRPFIITQHFKRHADDAGYLESRIWLPYVKDETMKNLEIRLKNIRAYNEGLQKRIDKYNKLPWWRKMFEDV